MNDLAKRRATLRFEVSPMRFAEAMFRSLRVESRLPLTGRSRVEVGLEGETLVLRFEAESTSTLRAAINSYLRWIITISRLYRVIEGRG